MRLNTIKQELEAIGYFCFITDDLLIAGTTKQYDKELDLYSLQNTIGIKIKNGEILVDYAKAQISMEKAFKSLNNAIDFIKTERPK
ncbi:MAG: hypothetical protein ACPGVD_11190 [Flavobacteriales bacterium]